MDLTAALRAQIDEIVAIDTHVHLGSEGMAQPWPIQEQVKTSLLGGYLGAYLTAAGADPTRCSGNDLDSVLQHARPFLDSLKATGTHSATLEALRDLFEFSGDMSNHAAVAEVTRKIAAAYAQGQHARWEEIFRQARVQVALKNVQLPYFTDYLPSLAPEQRAIETRLLRAVPRVDAFLFGPFDLKGNRILEITMPYWRDALERTIAALGARPTTFEAYLKCIDAAFDAYKRYGAVGVKLTVGFVRELRFEDVPKAEAERVFRNRDRIADRNEARPFQDYVFRYILDLCAAKSLPIQMHTGLQAGNDSNLPDCNPIGLTSLFQVDRFRDVRFILLHCGYPYTGEAAVLAKSFANVYLDLAWLPLLSPSICARCLGEFLELVPSSKLMHGADVPTAEDLYSVTKRFRRIVSNVLGSMVESRHVTEKDAVRLGSQILRDNARAVFSLEER